jgi:hypothetical protein
MLRARFQCQEAECGGSGFTGIDDPVEEDGPCPHCGGTARYEYRDEDQEPIPALVEAP